jgi:leucyl-tRNA synthetase
MKEYNHLKLEKKWQGVWEKSKIYEAKTGAKGKKFYGLIEFPYPSGAGLHVGHIRSNTAMDIITRKRRMEGYNVLYPIGWDAFGLPTENYAIKTGIQPAKVTKTNTDIFRRQLKSVGFGFDWSREIDTTNPAYFKWTQWIFLQMYKKGLAYKSRTTINWCPKDKIGLANEEVVGGLCDRCGSSVEKKEKEQWMLAITKYADRLDSDLDKVDYLEKIKIQQRNWIGKSEGSEIEFKIKDTDEKIKVFTTRADTIFGATYVVLAPEHSLIKNLELRITNWKEVEEYIKEVKNKPDIERTGDDKEKSGVELKGVRAINPANGQDIPIWIADYVLATYGTGAVMAVPAHDERDFEFAKKYKLEIKQVIAPYFTKNSEDKDAVRIDKETVKRKTLYAFIFDKKNDRFLCLDWEKYNWHSGIIGGVDEGETYQEAALREIKEETGFINLKYIKDIGGEQHNHFFAAHKDVNRYAFGQGMLFELVNEEKVSTKEEETKNHKMVWIKSGEMSKWLNLASFQYMWQIYVNNSDCFTDDGILLNSGKFNDFKSEEARKEITKFVGGKIVTKYKLRDWVFSRQRYWGEPIPMVHCDKCGIVPVPEKDLPVLLPKVKSYAPTDNGESPLAIISKWVNTTCPKCKGKAKRETDTMPNWAGSSWYFLRYADPKNKKEFASKKALTYWMKNGVDWYNGGMEHTTLHLLYSRFWHKFLYDLKVVPTSEPYMKRTSHGMILAEGGVKMSKSIGNTIDPKDIVNSYGADTLRIYEMFMGPFDQAVSWSTESIIGSRRFLDKVWRIGERIIENEELKIKNLAGVGKSSSEFITLLHKTIKKIGEDIENMSFNTAISSMMILVNEMEKNEVSKEHFKMFLQILSPFAPHITEELWEQLSDKKLAPRGRTSGSLEVRPLPANIKSIHVSSWPKYNPKKIIDENIKIAVQVNGKVRSEIIFPKDMSEEEIKIIALKDKTLSAWIDGKEIKRFIYVPGRVINIVV